MPHELAPTRAARLPWIAAAAWAVLLTPCALWGLPSAQLDAYLFERGAAWSAERFNATAGAALRAARSAGADTDLDPLRPADALVDLTATDAQRAAILLRYRLYSRQPDEMITFQALQRMKPRAGDFDPHLYQYGGAFIYLVGAVIGAAALLGVAPVTPSIDFYLDNPEAFARFYLLARLSVLGFGVAALVAIWRLTQRCAGDLAAWMALVLFALTPAMLCGALEAKPHLPGVCMTLWATLAAIDFFEQRRWRNALRLGIYAGLATGLVLTGAAAALLWPALALAIATPSSPARADLRRDLLRLLAAAALAVAAYAVTNPYFVINALLSPQALQSNLSNSTAMYSLERAGDGVLNVSRLLLEGGGVATLVALAVPFVRRPGSRWPVAVVTPPAVGMLGLCCLIGAGKPAEFARFLLLPIALLSLAAAIPLAAWARRAPRLAGVTFLALLALSGAPRYLVSFQRDASGVWETRRLAADWLARHSPLTEAIGVIQEPAPYAIPPLEFDRRTVLLLPRHAPAPLPPLPNWLVLTADHPDAFEQNWWRAYYSLSVAFESPLGRSPITWANKSTFIFRRADLQHP